MRSRFVRLVMLLSAVSSILVFASQSHAVLAQNSTQTPKADESTEKFIIIYKSSASERDKDKVRSKLKAKVTGHFNDPTMEELTIEIPKSSDAKTFTNKILTTAEKIRTVQSIQPIARYNLD